MDLDKEVLAWIKRTFPHIKGEDNELLFLGDLLDLHKCINEDLTKDEIRDYLSQVEFNTDDVIHYANRRHVSTARRLELGLELLGETI